MPDNDNTHYCGSVRKGTDLIKQVDGIAGSRLGSTYSSLKLGNLLWYILIVIYNLVIW